MDKRKQQLIVALVLFALAVVLSYYSVDERVVITKSAPIEADVLLVLDVSRSMNNSVEGVTKIESAKDAAIEFLDALNTPHRVGLMAFSDSAMLLNPITSDRSILKQEIKALEADGGTAMRAAVKNGTDILSQGGTNRRLCMVLMTDGLPNIGHDPTPEIPTLISKNITVYTVGFGTDVDENLLRNISTKTNGNYFYARSGEELVSAFVNVTTEIDRSSEISNILHYGSRGLIIAALILIIFLPVFIKTGKKFVAKVKGE